MLLYRMNTLFLNCLYRCSAQFIQLTDRNHHIALNPANEMLQKKGRCPKPIDLFFCKFFRNWMILCRCSDVIGDNTNLTAHIIRKIKGKGLSYCGIQFCPQRNPLPQFLVIGTLCPLHQGCIIDFEYTIMNMYAARHVKQNRITGPCR